MTDETLQDLAMRFRVEAAKWPPKQVEHLTSIARQLERLKKEDRVMAEDIVDRLDAIAEALSGMTDKLFALGQREAGLLISQASASVEAAAQEITALRKERDELRERFASLDRAIESVIVKNDKPNRVRVDGVWYDGPLADAHHKLMRTVQKVARAALGNERTGQ